jgi:RNA polymerase sigma-70 factor (ECF subfamily)
VHLNTDEKVLLMLIKQSDHVAYKQVFDLYVVKVYNYIYGYIRNKQHAEDLAQDVFRKLWEKRLQLDKDKSLSGFIFTLCYHQVVDHFRTNKNFQLIFSNNVDANVQDPTTADSHLQYGQLESLYQQAINMLPARKKEVYLLSRHEGLSNKEIARRMDVSVKTVENQMTAALHLIRNFFQRIGYMLLVFL